nr:FRG domain-containing protein [Burkholderia anthina]
MARQHASPDVEARMLDEFTRRALPHLEPGQNLEACDWLALAQQHGMRTRLLDWSGNALAALWFAVRRAGESGGDGVVWCLSHDADDIATAADRRAAGGHAHQGVPAASRHAEDHRAGRLVHDSPL